MKTPINPPMRLTAGFNTATVDAPLADYPFPEPFHTSNNALSSTRQSIAEYVTDFMDSVAEYTVTGLSSTFALAAANGGAALLTPGAATTATSAYKTATMLSIAAGSRFWFQSRFSISAFATGVSAYVGLQEAATTTEGLWFAVSQTGVVSLVSTVGGVPTTLLSNLATMVAGTEIDLALSYNGADLLAFVNGVLTGRATAPTLSSAVLGPVFQITPTATQTMTIDFCQAVTEVAR